MTFFLFPKIKEILKRRHFNEIDDIKSNTTAALKAIPQNQFENCFEEWTRRWHQCIAPKGSTMKANTMVFSNVICSTFTAMSSRTLLQYVCKYIEKIIHNLYMFFFVYVVLLW